MSIRPLRVLNVPEVKAKYVDSMARMLWSVGKAEMRHDIPRNLRADKAFMTGFTDGFIAACQLLGVDVVYGPDGERLL